MKFIQRQKYLTVTRILLTRQAPIFEPTWVAGTPVGAVKDLHLAKEVEFQVGDMVLLQVIRLTFPMEINICSQMTIQIALGWP